MKEHRGSHIDCKHLSKSYLQCRMDKCVCLLLVMLLFVAPSKWRLQVCLLVRLLLLVCRGLMQEEELDNLGFHEDGMKKVRNKTFEGRKESEQQLLVCLLACLLCCLLTCCLALAIATHRRRLRRRTRHQDPTIQGQMTTQPQRYNNKSTSHMNKTCVLVVASILHTSSYFSIVISMACLLRSGDSLRAPGCAS